MQFHRISVTSACLLLVALDICLGTQCEDLGGRWYNQLGSVLVLHHSQDGELTGTYETQVEQKHGSAGNAHSHIVVGAAPYNKPASVFGFAVMFNSGGSTCAWTGQCHICNGEETLMTSWLLRSRVTTCIDKWKSTLIGQDTFTRGRPDNSPTYNVRIVPQMKRDTSQVLKNAHRITKRDASGGPPIDGCNIHGYWYNYLGSQVILHRNEDNSVRGKYHTVVEKAEGASGSRGHSAVYGITNWDQVNSTLAMFVVWNEGESITGWVGQCHMCNKTEVLETTWLLRSKVKTCNENWMSTHHGENSFLRDEHTKGPGRQFVVEIAGRVGEVLVNGARITVSLHSVLVVTTTVMTVFCHSLW
ncbi:hypothetical protein NP493_36g03003 [Ridgeia piscesae]|uniref:Uncharacterized protein n=1 Tax=Ridgeia piscesae TaxID=27915 RepID=A0AAD9UK53_RIDPI|nr:hypothetical protein NP493_36g03003 [Ridgeia piscesae]